jgi:hypothetical protein
MADTHLRRVRGRGVLAAWWGHILRHVRPKGSKTCVALQHSRYKQVTNVVFSNLSGIVSSCESALKQIILRLTCLGSLGVPLLPNLHRSEYNFIFYAL